MLALRTVPSVAGSSASWSIASIERLSSSCSIRAVRPCRFSSRKSSLSCKCRRCTPQRAKMRSANSSPASPSRSSTSSWVRTSGGSETARAAIPRTGTRTQKLALEQLGLAPCYHWVNVLANLDEVELWDRAMDGEAIWEEVFGDSRATVDWPGGYFYRELIDAYPDAKVLLSVRDPQAWERSFRETIWTMSHGRPLMPLAAAAV